MTQRNKKWITIALLLLGLAAFGESADVASLIRKFFPIPSTTGNERPLALAIENALPKGLAIEEDGLGGFAVRFGKGGPRTMILVPLDGFGYFVSGISPEGYLRLDRAVPPPHQQFDAYLLGQPVVISTARGPVQGVVSQPAMHLLTPERRKALVENFGLDDAFVDIGVRSEKEALAKGVRLLDALTFWPVLTELAGKRWAGPSLGVKTAGAVLASVAAGLKGETLAGETVLVFAAQTKFPSRGRGVRISLGATRARNVWQPGKVIIVDVTAAEKDAQSPSLGKGPVFAQSGESAGALRRAFEQAAANGKIPVQWRTASDSPLAAAFGDMAADTVTLALPVQFLNTPSEIIQLEDVEALGVLLSAFFRQGGER